MTTLPPAVTVQFSGNARTYNYMLQDNMLLPDVGNRIVVPGKLKEDGTLALSIATVVAVLEKGADDATQYAVQTLIPSRIDFATHWAVKSSKEPQNG